MTTCDLVINQCVSTFYFFLGIDNLLMYLFIFCLILSVGIQFNHLLKVNKIVTYCLFFDH